MVSSSFQLSGDGGLQHTQEGYGYKILLFLTIQLQFKHEVEELHGVVRELGMVSPELRVPRTPQN